MRVPLSWLSDFVEVPDDVDKLAYDLSAQGLKVESVERPSGDLEGVVVAEVMAIEAHPNADRLILVEVDTGSERRRVVCGAHNFAVGDRVPLSPPGARLPGSGAIEGKKVRGVMSDGMLCSARELGVSDDHSGILVLPETSPLGADVRQVLGLGEVVFVLDITPNRPDAMSLLGVAREVAALTGSEVLFPSPGLEEAGEASSASCEVIVEDGAGCPRYLARVLRGTDVGPSEPWVQARLAAAGIRPVSNVVDATNYALWVTGHPLHAFDLSKLSDATIVVRRARPGERITTLDAVERTLDPDDLVIADASRAVALAGVMGGLDTEVTEATKEVLLESAYFEPRTILRSSRRHGLRSEASARFERGTDPNALGAAADLAASLISSWSGAVAAPEPVDVYPEPIEPITLRIDKDRVDRLLGTDLGLPEIASSLEQVGFDVSQENDSLRAVIPTRRPDVTIPEDLVEEVARMMGYDRIPATLPAGPGRHGSLTREQRLERETRRILTGAGVTEAYTSSFISRKVHSRMGYPEDGPVGPERIAPLEVANPLSEEESLLRPSLLPGLLQAVSRNVARRNLTVRLFEIGHCFRRSKTKDPFPEEPLQLGLVMHGSMDQDWHTPSRELDLWDLKGAVEVMLASLYVSEVDFAPERRAPWHPGRGARIEAGGKTLGFAGEVAPGVAEAFELPQRAFAAELFLDDLFAVAGEAVLRSEPPRYPAVLLDLAVGVPEATSAADVLQVAREYGGEVLERARLFDVYRGDQVGEGRKSLALSLTFRSSERTLTDVEAMDARDGIAAAIADRFGGRVRGA